MGYRGCWVVTIGTNDAANVAIGGVPDLSTRLDRMMVLFGSDPVLWVDSVTRLDEGPYADTNMQSWNQVLDEAALRFPTLHVFRWSDVAVDEWFVSDGIHYTSDGGRGVPMRSPTPWLRRFPWGTVTATFGDSDVYARRR